MAFRATLRRPSRPFAGTASPGGARRAAEPAVRRAGCRGPRPRSSGHAPRRRAAVGSRELRTHVDDAGGEVDVVPYEAEHLGDPQAGVEHGRDHQPVAWRAERQQPLDLRAAEHALAATLRPRALVVLEPLDGVGNVQPRRRAKLMTLWSVATALAEVFGEQPLPRSRSSSSATSSTVIDAIRRGRAQAEDGGRAGSGAPRACADGARPPLPWPRSAQATNRRRCRTAAAERRARRLPPRPRPAPDVGSAPLPDRARPCGTRASPHAGSRPRTSGSAAGRSRAPRARASSWCELPSFRLLLAEATTLRPRGELTKVDNPPTVTTGRVRRRREAPALQDRPMELAGLEPATSWVRSHDARIFTICRQFPDVVPVPARLGWPGFAGDSPQLRPQNRLCGLNASGTAELAEGAVARADETEGELNDRLPVADLVPVRPRGVWGWSVSHSQTRTKAGLCGCALESHQRRPAGALPISARKPWKPAFAVPPSYRRLTGSSHAARARRCRRGRGSGR